MTHHNVRNSTSVRLLAAALLPTALLLGSLGCNETNNQAPGGVGWVGVSSGSFQMGCQEDDQACSPSEKPGHLVTVPAFELTETEITQAQYSAVKGDNPSFFQPAPDCAECPVYEACDSCPVEQVDWYDAAAFCNAIGARLPTEAEWEFAARAGSRARHLCGDDSSCLSSIAWHAGNASYRTQKVRQKDPNAWGLYDMLGNVWEWVADGWSDSYQDAPSDGTARSVKGSRLRVLRGGGWQYAPASMTVTRRMFYGPGVRDPLIGFRCARSAN